MTIEVRAKRSDPQAPARAQRAGGSGAGKPGEGAPAEAARMAQDEFTAIRRQAPSWKAFLASPRLVVLPRRFMRKLGGGAAIYRWTCISTDLLEAPGDVRRSIIAHEWAHAASGHCLATTGALGLALLYAVLSATMPGGYFWPSVNIVLLLMIAGLLFWALHANREFEADALAARVVGAANMAKALRWMIEHLRDGETNEVATERLRRLDGLAS